MQLQESDEDDDEVDPKALVARFRQHQQQQHPAPRQQQRAPLPQPTTAQLPADAGDDIKTAIATRCAGRHRCAACWIVTAGHNVVACLMQTQYDAEALPAGGVTSEAKHASTCAVLE